MTQKDYLVSGMTSDHCIAAVRDEISHLPGVTHVEVDLVPDAVSTVKVSSDEALPEERVREAVDEAGYHLVAAR